MKFRFRLERVLGFVKLKESLKKMEVANSIQRLNDLKNRKIFLEENIRKVLQAEVEHLAALSDWKTYHTDKIRLDAEEVKQVEKSIVEEADNLEEKRYELIKISMKKRGLESLREKKWSEFRLNQSRRQQKTLDEAHRLTSAIHEEREE